VDETEVVRIVNPCGDRLLSPRFGFMRQPPRKAEAPGDRRCLVLHVPPPIAVGEVRDHEGMLSRARAVVRSPVVTVVVGEHDNGASRDLRSGQDLTSCPRAHSPQITMRVRPAADAWRCSGPAAPVLALSLSPPPHPTTGS
jgi:hypothetical protein